MLVAKRGQPPLPFAGLFTPAISNPELARMDRILDDDEMLDIMRRSYDRNVGRSKRRGAPMVALDRLLRTTVLKHEKNWSFRELASELARNLDYRAFTRFFDDPIGSFKTLSRNMGWLDAQAVRELNERLLQIAREHEVIQGRAFRQDTTVVEANIHYPTDSTLLQDGCRVLQRLSKRAAELIPSLGRVRDRTRSVLHRVLEIHRSAKTRKPEAAEERQRCYASLLRTTRAVLTQAQRTARRLGDRRTTRKLDPFEGLQAEALRQEIDEFAPRVGQVIKQTRARVFRGITNSPGKLVSLFVPEAQPIRKGKAHKPAEFGQLVEIIEVEQGFVSDYRVHGGNPADATLLLPALHRHREHFGRVPHKLATDRGFWSAANEQGAKELGVKQVAIPKRGPLSEARRHLQRTRWFRRLQRWRANGEGRIGTLKNRYAMNRCMYKGEHATERWVGWCVFANNLTVVARRSQQLNDDCAGTHQGTRPVARKAA